MDFGCCTLMQPIELNTQSESALSMDHKLNLVMTKIAAKQKSSHNSQLITKNFLELWTWNLRDILQPSKLQFSQCALEELCQWYSSSPTAGFMWNEIPRVFFSAKPYFHAFHCWLYAARLAARWEKLSHSKFLLSPNAQCGKMHEKVAFCMHAPYDLTWPLHFRCFFSVFVLELLRQLPACLLTCTPACKLYTIYFSRFRIFF